MGVYGVIIAGWASNSKYAFLGAMRSAAQMVSYELAMGFALVVRADGRRAASTCPTSSTAQGAASSPQGAQLPVVELAAAAADAGRLLRLAAWPRPTAHPFDVVEGESEIVAGHMVEYSGMSFALFFLAEYMNMILISALTAIMFFGGWQAPIDSRLHSTWLPPLRLAAHQDLLHRLDVPVDPRHLPALPLRPDHAPGLEGVHPAHPGLDRVWSASGCRRPGTSGP